MLADPRLQFVEPVGQYPMIGRQLPQRDEGLDDTMAVSLLRVVAAIRAPCSVKAHGK